MDNHMTSNSVQTYTSPPIPETMGSPPDQLFVCEYRGCTVAYQTQWVLDQHKICMHFDQHRDLNDCTVIDPYLDEQHRKRPFNEVTIIPWYECPQRGCQYRSSDESAYGCAQHRHYGIPVPVGTGIQGWNYSVKTMAGSVDENDGNYKSDCQLYEPMDSNPTSVVSNVDQVLGCDVNDGDYGECTPSLALNTPALTDECYATTVSQSVVGLIASGRHALPVRPGGLSDGI
ncbi:unnamed protein product [Oppiella nova]|uniref:C2H2-type domain-containing protein n=1 Tax=Oppiella nova TaxID=334625 RepID=A0A7R9LG36_9ACAR|nr:unnamed protein product [Oppiella nova]CAG2163313.1 unnamed protein product [Oppiella nova]